MLEIFDNNKPAEVFNFLENTLVYDDAVKIFDAYKDDLREKENGFWLKDKSATVQERELAIALGFVIRCNDIFITNDIKRNNDWLFVIQNRPNEYIRRYVYQCTADPSLRRSGMATLMPQIYTANIRNHHNVFGRPALCQDNCPVTVRRYIKESEISYYQNLGFEVHEAVEVVGGYKYYFFDTGHFGIHIHNPAQYWNSSLGCVILANDNDYKNEFKPLLNEAKTVQSTKIPIAVFQKDRFQEIYSSLIS